MKRLVNLSLFVNHFSPFLDQRLGNVNLIEYVISILSGVKKLYYI